MKQNKKDVLFVLRLPAIPLFIGILKGDISMYSCKASVMFLGAKKRNFQDTEMYSIDVYSDGDVDSFFVASNNPIVPEVLKLKPTQQISIDLQWNKTKDGWKHRLVGLRAI